MCQFFSFVTKDGAKFYFDWEARKAALSGDVKFKGIEMDGHSSICAFYKLDCDKVNKYEYNSFSSMTKVGNAITIGLLTKTKMSRKILGMVTALENTLKGLRLKPGVFITPQKAEGRPLFLPPASFLAANGLA